VAACRVLRINLLSVFPPAQQQAEGQGK